MKRRLFTLVMITLLISACGGDDKVTPTPSPLQSADVQGTSEPEQPVTARPVTPATSLETAAPVSASATPVPPLSTLVPPTAAPTPTSEPTVSDVALVPSQGELGELRITILYDNFTYDDRLQAEWGFAALIEYGGQTLFFDTGGDAPTLLSNMAVLGIDPASIETVVLSHAHADHVGGLEGLLQSGARPTVFMLPSFPRSFKSQVQTLTDMVEVTPGQAIAAGILTTGEISGGPVREQALVIETAEGLVVITGCAHPGIVQIVEQAIELSGEPVRLVVGGFHLIDKNQDQIKAIVDDFRRLGVQQVAPTHCTGEEAIESFSEAYGSDYLEAGTGRVFVVGTTTEVAPLSTPADPHTLISQENLFAFMENLTAIQTYSGWRNSATEGEAEALDYVARRLGEMKYLGDLGLELERQTFHVFLATELWETRLHLTVNGQEVEVPADGLRGPRDDITQALRFDSDGTLNDAAPDPVVVEGPGVLIRSDSQIQSLSQSDVQGRVVFLDYAVVDRTLLGMDAAVGIAWELLDKEPAGLVLVTQFSNQQGESHGFGVGDVSALNWVETESASPILYVRLEDLAPAGITTWDDLQQIETARLVWDADVFSPGTSGNLVARIPGADSSQAMILGAHIDSPNAPGAMDDGSGSVVLLEVARVLDAARTQPATDLYLVWFGSEELGLYGSSHFAATHQELLDRTLAMLQIDNLTHPLDGIRADLHLVTWSYSRLGDERLTWPDYLSEAAAQMGIEPIPRDAHFLYSDNTVFNGFDVPNADLIYENEPAMEAAGGFHNAAHVHDPYDTVELAREVGDVLEQMARVALIAALETGQERPTLRVAPLPERRALFIGSHTESIHMLPTAFSEMGMALAWEGLDVDLIPYRQAVILEDLDPNVVPLVVVLPVLDYPSPDGDPTLYDEFWMEDEIDALETYVAEGGLLVLTNSVHRLKYGNRSLDPNEDWTDVNPLATRFGVSYQEGAPFGHLAHPEGNSPLMIGIAQLELAEDNGVPFTMTSGQILARVDRTAVVGLVDHGDAGGEVLVLADVGMLGAGWDEPANLAFWQNLARYAQSR